MTVYVKLCDAKKLNNNIDYEGITEMNSNNVLLPQDGTPSHTAKHHQLSAERKITIIEPGMLPANSPDYAVCSSECIVMTVRNCGTAETGNRGRVVLTVSEVH